MGKEIIKKHEGHKKCGFRDKINVCKFKEEDCNPVKCDMYNIPFTIKGITTQSKLERKEVIDLTKKMKEIKKKGEHKTNPDTYKTIKSLRVDKVSGMFKLSQAYIYLKRSGEKK